MKKIWILLLSSVFHFTLFAQSVIIEPGAQVLNGDSTIDYQMDIYGNGLTVQEKEGIVPRPVINIETGRIMVYDTYYDRLVAGYHFKSEYDSTGWSSISLGPHTIADYKSVAIGDSSRALGSSSIAIGNRALATNRLSYAFGNIVEATGSPSFAIGSESIASGSSSISIGVSSVASGIGAKAFCSYCEASGDYSTSLGSKMYTNNKTGTFMIGDEQSGAAAHYANVSNRMVTRFRNGYYFYTDASSTVGSKMLAGDNSWSTASDSTIKENFQPSNGEKVLNSVAQMRVGTWNYKTQDPSRYRHWGVMAQDFYKHFGQDDFGTIGSDTLIASADFDGVAFAAIKALETRTRLLQEELEKERRLSSSLELTVGRLQRKAKEFETQFTELEKGKYLVLKDELKELRSMLLKAVALKE